MARSMGMGPVSRCWRSVAKVASRAVGGKGQCAACHGDGAAGRFYPANISIPKETTL